MNAELALGTVAIIIALWGGIIITVRGATPAERFVGVLILAFGLFLLFALYTALTGGAA